MKLGWLALLLLALPLADLSCSRRVCDEENGTIQFGDTAFLRPCTSDKVFLLPEDAELFPEGAVPPPQEASDNVGGEAGAAGANGTGATEGSGETGGTTGTGGATLQDTAFGSVVYFVKILSEDGKPRQYVHADVELSGDVGLVEVTPVVTTAGKAPCKIEAPYWVHCVMQADGGASFRVTHGNRGAGTVHLKLYTRFSEQTGSSGLGGSAGEAPGAGGAIAGDADDAPDAIESATLHIRQGIPRDTSIQVSARALEAQSMIWCGTREKSDIPCSRQQKYALDLTLIDALGQPVSAAENASFDMFLQAAIGSASFSSDGDCPGDHPTQVHWTLDRGTALSLGPTLCVGAEGFSGWIVTPGGNGSLLKTPVNAPAIPYLVSRPNDELGMGGNGGEGPVANAWELLACPGVAVPAANIAALSTRRCEAAP